MGPRRKKLAELRQQLTELEDFLNEKINNSPAAEHIGRAEDRAYGKLQEANRRHQKAVADLTAAAQEHQQALDADEKAAQAFLDMKDKADESWLEDELQAAMKVTKTKSANHRAARDELDAAAKAADEAQFEFGKCEKANFDFFVLVQKRNKEIPGKISELKIQIKALEDDLEQNPSLGRKLKDVVNKMK